MILTYTVGNYVFDQLRFDAITESHIFIHN